MLRSTSILPASVALGVALTLPGQQLTVRWTSKPNFPVAAEHIVDVDGDGKDELVIVGRRGEVRVWHADGLRGALQLPDAARSLVSVGRLVPDGSRHLVVLSARGIFVHAFAKGTFATDAVRVLPRERLTLRTGVPQLSAFLQDVNGDGRDDLVLPAPRQCTLYLNRAGGEPYRFVRAGRIEVKSTTGASLGGRALSDRMSAQITVPDLRTYDVNGDGRKDLIAEESGRRGYHLQSEDGSYPEKPDVELDLGIFRDTTPKATTQFGQTASSDNPMIRTRDLSADGIPDYVILHRRKVWVFHGTKKGPQFENPSIILKTAEDLSFALLVNLDDDQRPDLMLVRLQVPSIASLLAGLIMSWDIPIEVIGYPNVGGAKTFATKPKWRRTVRLRAPAILDILMKTEEYVDRFKTAADRFRYAVEADLDGDDKPDALLLSEDGKQLAAYLGTDGVDAPSGTTERQIRKYAFEDENTIWDVDRLLVLMNEQANSRELRLTKGLKQAASITLRDPEVWQLDFGKAADLDGDGRDELVVRYLKKDAPEVSEFDVLGLKK